MRITAELPVLIPGHDTLPTHCPHCHARVLSRALPQGTHRFDPLTCLMCGREIAWIRAPLPSTTQRPSYSPQPDAPPPSLSTFVRLISCSAVCDAMQRHDAYTHENWGRRQVALPQLVGRIQTAGLVVDADLKQAFLGTTPLHLSVREYGLLDLLAGSLGHTCPLDDLIRGVFESAIRGSAERHMLRVLKCRLRDRLKDLRGLIVTVPGQGIRLNRCPPCDYTGALPDPAPDNPRALEARWTTFWPSCRGCGTTRRRHKGTGLCTQCWQRDRRGTLTGDPDTSSPGATDGD